MYFCWFLLRFHSSVSVVSVLCPVSFVSVDFVPDFSRILISWKISPGSAPWLWVVPSVIVVIVRTAAISVVGVRRLHRVRKRRSDGYAGTMRSDVRSAWHTHQCRQNKDGKISFHISSICLYSFLYLVIADAGPSQIRLRDTWPDNFKKPWYTRWWNSSRNAILLHPQPLLPHAMGVSSDWVYEMQVRITLFNSIYLNILISQ